MVKAIGKTKKTPGIEVIDIEEPALGPEDVLVRVKATAICGTDLHYYHWDAYAERHNPGLPRVLGHEFCGDVIKIGENVKTLHPGDRVSGETHIPCKSCIFCRTGKMHICKDMKIFGVDTIYGSFAPYTALPEVTAVKIPDEIPYEVGAVLEPLGVAVHAVSEAQIRPGDFVVVMGCGPIGVYAQQLAKLAGASKIISTDVKDYRLNLSRKAGVGEAINVLRSDPVARVMELTNGVGADVVIEVSGANSAIKQALDSVKRTGRIVLVGTAHKPTEVDTTNYLIYKEIKMSGITGRLMFDTWYQSIKIAVNKLIDLGVVTTHRFELDDAEEAFSLIDKGEGGKVVFLP
ncbi:MAG: alcohol dehydrogenase catalytic domain-containing protein [Nitrososphaeria archaeon]